MTSLDAALHQHSPRLQPRRGPWSGTLVTVLGPALLVALGLLAWRQQGLLAWSVGLVYVLYDTGLLVFTAWHIRRQLMQPAMPERADGATAALGVVIAARNEAAVLVATIDALTRQHTPPEHIIVVDDGSTDASVAVLQQRYGLQAGALGQPSQPAPALPSLRLLRVPHGGKARALNAAIVHLDTPLMMTLDADTRLEPGALRAMRDAFAQDPLLVSATGVLEPECGGGGRFARVLEHFQRYEYIRNFLSRLAWSGPNCLLLVSGACAAFRRDAVVQVGGFDPDCLVEDYELMHRLHRYAQDHQLGWRVRAVGAARARTDAPASLQAFLRQRRRWFGGFLQTQWWNRDMVANPRYGRLGVWMLTVKAFDTVQPIYGLTAFGVLVTFAVQGRLAVVGPVLAVMLAKVGIDLSFYLWSIGVYRRWTLSRHRPGLLLALLTSLVEPFTFQLLRHASACWGWIRFLRGSTDWGTQRRALLPLDPA